MREIAITKCSGDIIKTVYVNIRCKTKIVKNPHTRRFENSKYAAEFDFSTLYFMLESTYAR